MRRILIYIIIPISIVACTKVKSEKWIVGDVKTMEKQTGIPIEGSKVSMCFLRGNFMGSDWDYETLGYTDDKGEFYFEWKIPRKTSTYHINIVPPGAYKFPLNTSYDKCDWTVSQNVSEDKLNEFHNSYSWNYRFKLHILNSTCFDENDSVIVTSDYTGFTEGASGLNFTFYGCADTLFGFGPYGEFLTLDQTLSIEITSHKNGVIENSSLDLVLEKEGLNEILIEY